MQNPFLKHAVLVLAVFVTFSVTACDTTPDAKAAKNMPEQVEDNHGKSDKRTDQEEDGHEDETIGNDTEEEHEDIVRLSDAELHEFNIELSSAGPGSISTFIDLPGEIVINSDAMAHVVPRVAGIVRKVNKKLGDHVEAGEILATLESRELAELKVNYLSAWERFNLANEIFSREEKLWQKKISAEQDFLATKQVLAEARINLRSIEQKLHALGFSEEHLTKKINHPDITFTTYQVKAPFAGTVIKKHITLGESLKEDSEIFIIADLSTVWVDISIYQKDLPWVNQGMKAVIYPGHGLESGFSNISYVGPIIGETTRTAPARITLKNTNGKWRPGMFITAKIAINDKKLPLVIPRAALQTFEGQQVVFVRDEDGFEPHPVTLGIKGQDQVEVISGLTAGQTYVSKGAFTLKAQLSKGAFGDGHNH